MQAVSIASCINSANAMVSSGRSRTTPVVALTGCVPVLCLGFQRVGCIESIYTIAVVFILRGHFALLTFPHKRSKNQCKCYYLCICIVTIAAYGGACAAVLVGGRAYLAASVLEESSTSDAATPDASYKPFLASARAIGFPATVTAGFGTAADPHTYPMI